MNKELEVERYHQDSLESMVICTNTYGPGEVDLPISDRDVERHIFFLGYRLGYKNVKRSDLWTTDLPIGLWYETTKGSRTYRAQQEYHEIEVIADNVNTAKKRKINNNDGQRSPTSEHSVTPTMDEETLALLYNDH